MAVSTPAQNEQGTYRWFPKIVPLPEDHGEGEEHEESASAAGYYELPPDVVWIPFIPSQPLYFSKPLSALYNMLINSTSDMDYASRMQAQHVVLDHFLPFYTLLSMFGLIHEDDSTNNKNSRPPSLFLTTLKHPKCLDSNSTKCQDSPLPSWNNDSDDDDDMVQQQFAAFLPMLSLAQGHTPFQSARKDDRDIRHPNNNHMLHHPPDVGAVRYVCARRAVLGFRSLTDHGLKQHGEMASDYQMAHNVGRGLLLYQFRNYIFRNLQIPHKRDDNERLTTTKMTTPYNMLVSVSQSILSERHDFTEQVQLLRNTFPPEQLSVEQVDLSALSSWRDRIVSAAQSHFYLSVMGGGESILPALFLPRGATLILFFNDQQEYVRGKKRTSTRPVMLNWDVWQHLSHVRVHWMPLRTRNNPQDREVLLSLIRNEMAYMKREKDDSLITLASNQELAEWNLRLFQHPKSDPFPPSAVHCVGDNFVRHESFRYRSCEMRNLCADRILENGKESRGTLRFVLVRSEEQAALDERLIEWDHDFAVASTTMTTSVLEGRNVRFVYNETWFPSTAEPAKLVYMLPDDVVWIPYSGEPENIQNPGHLLWDFFLPFFKLLTMFGLEREEFS